jgi:hypothetical protein
MEFLERIYVAQTQNEYAYTFQERLSPKVEGEKDNTKVGLTDLGHENGGGWN